MPHLTRFDELDKEGKIQFFQKCQDLLLANQPDSPWVLREGSQKNYFISLFIKYKGIAYQTEDVVILFNKLRYENKDDILGNHATRMFEPPAQSPNTYSIDFITAKLTPEILLEAGDYFKDPGMEWVCFLRGQKLSVFNFESFKRGMRQRFDID